MPTRWRNPAEPFSDKVLSVLRRLDLDSLDDSVTELREEEPDLIDRLVAVHNGDIDSSDWRPPAFITVVRGDITTSNCLNAQSAIEPEIDMGGLLLVIGDVRCRDFCSAYQKTTIIDGNLQVDRLLVNCMADSALFVTGQLRAEIFYGLDIWAEVGGLVKLRCGEGYCLPTGYTDASAQAIRPIKPLADANINVARLEELGESVADHISDDSLWTPT